jgi:hypothetical protein
MKHLVTTNTIDPPTKNETMQLYGSNKTTFILIDSVV